MTRDDIIRLAREAGMVKMTSPSGAELGDWWGVDMPDIERFAALVAERDTALLQQALEALEERYVGALRDKAMDALRTALAEPEQEPEQNTVTCVCGAVWEGNLMVHAPRQRKPLTEPELHEINPTWPAPGQHWDYEDVLEFVRAIERAHGIGGEA